MALATKELPPGRIHSEVTNNHQQTQLKVNNLETMNFLHERDRKMCLAKERLKNRKGQFRRLMMTILIITNRQKSEYSTPFDHIRHTSIVARMLN